MSAKHSPHAKPMTRRVLETLSYLMPPGESLRERRWRLIYELVRQAQERVPSPRKRSLDATAEASTPPLEKTR